MERVEFEYSMKNISVPADKEYIKRFIEKTETFIKIYLQHNRDA